MQQENGRSEPKIGKPLIFWGRDTFHTVSGNFWYKDVMEVMKVGCATISQKLVYAAYLHPVGIEDTIKLYEIRLADNGRELADGAIHVPLFT